MPENGSTADMDVSGAGQAAGIQLPPALANLISALRDDRRALLKDKPIADKEVTAFLAHFLYPRLISCVEGLGIGLTETYMLASQSFTETSRMRKYVDEKLARAAKQDEDDGLARVDPDNLEALRDTLAALGLMLVKKLPDDVEVQVAFNLVSEAFVAVAGDGAEDEDEDDDEDDEDEDDEDVDEEGEDEDEEDDDETPVPGAGPAGQPE